MTSPRVLARRSLAAGAAWTAPLVLSSVAAPAYATSRGSVGPVSGTCAHYTDNLQTWANSDVVTAVTFGDPSAGPTQGPPGASISYATSSGADDTPGLTGTVSSSTRPGYLRLQLAPGMTRGDWVRLEIRFARAVTNPQLTLVRIDQVPGSYADHVVVSPPGFVVTDRGANVIGAGVPAAEDDVPNPAWGPFRNSTTEADISPSSEVTVTWPRTTGLTESLYVFLYAGDDTNASPGGQLIGVRDIGYDYCV